MYDFEVLKIFEPLSKYMFMQHFCVKMPSGFVNEMLNFFQRNLTPIAWHTPLAPFCNDEACKKKLHSSILCAFFLMRSIIMFIFSNDGFGCLSSSLSLCRGVGGLSKKVNKFIGKHRCSKIAKLEHIQIDVDNFWTSRHNRDVCKEIWKMRNDFHVDNGHATIFRCTSNFARVSIFQPVRIEKLCARCFEGILRIPKSKC